MREFSLFIFGISNKNLRRIKMSNPGVAEIKTKNGSLYVYSHYDGSRIVGMAKAAVRKAKPRWNDEAYAFRIIVDQLIKGGRDEELGYGLSLRDDQGDSPIVIIDLEQKMLTASGLGKIEFKDLDILK
jgi:hypothetical protein